MADIAGRQQAPEQRRGQAMVEFVIALPILLFVIFGIIEFGRMTFAWLAVQNAARFGVRYAVTGEYKAEYCDEAGNYLGATYVSADTDGGDPQDCKIPDTYTGTDPKEKEKKLIDIARLFSIRDAAEGGGAGLWLRPSVSGNYEQYLINHDTTHLGFPGEEGFIHVTVCSNRDGQFAFDDVNYVIPLCVDSGSSQLMDDAGGPGDRVKVYVEHRHPLFLPLLTSIWPSVSLNAERDGIVEKFRTSRALRCVRAHSVGTDLDPDSDDHADTYRDQHPAAHGNAHSGADGLYLRRLRGAAGILVGHPGKRCV